MTGIRVEWQADRDGIGHARIGRALRTPCGRQPIDPRHAWPIDSRCEACTAAVDAASTEAAKTAPTRAG